MVSVSNVVRFLYAMGSAKRASSRCWGSNWKPLMALYWKVSLSKWRVNVLSSLTSMA